MVWPYAIYAIGLYLRSPSVLQMAKSQSRGLRLVCRYTLASSFCRIWLCKPLQLRYAIQEQFKPLPISTKCPTQSLWCVE